MSTSTKNVFVVIQESLQQILTESKARSSFISKLEGTILPLLLQKSAIEKNPETLQRLRKLKNHVLKIVVFLKRQEVAVNRVEEPSSSATDSNKLDSFSKDRKQAIEQTILRQETSGGETLTFSDVAGLKIAKQALAEALVYPFTHPHWYTGDRKPWRSVLLYGPPGTGKSRLAQAVAGEVEAVFYCVSSSDLVSSWSGQSEKLVRELFLHARNQPDHRSVVFIDEIDSLCRQRSSSEEESSRRLKTELLVQIQQIQKADSNTYLLCATNCPWELDAAFLRRFQKRIFIGLPDKASRLQILRKRTEKSKLDPGIDWDSIGGLTEGLSGNDLADLAQEILFYPVRELQETTHWRFPGKGECRSGPAVPAMDGIGDPLVVEMGINQLPPRMTPVPRPVKQGITHKLDEQFVKRQVSEFSMEWNPNVELSSACGCALSPLPHALDSSTFGFHSIENSDT